MRNDRYRVPRRQQKVRAAAGLNDSSWPFCDTSVASCIPLLSLRRTMANQPGNYGYPKKERNAPDKSLRMAGARARFVLQRCSVPLTPDRKHRSARELTDGLLGFIEFH